MFWKKKKEQYEVITAEQQAEEKTEHYLQTSVPVENIKRYLVEMIEKNERLQGRVDELEKERKEKESREQKAREIAQVSATDYKRQRDEAERALRECQRKLEKTESEKENAEKKYNDAMVKLHDMQQGNESILKMATKTEQLITEMRNQLQSASNLDKMKKAEIVEALKNTLFLNQEENNEQK